MKNNKGQALVEFIIILPVLLLIVLATIDFGNVISKKYMLENDIDIVCDMYKNDNKTEISSYLSNIDASIDIKNNGKLTKITITRDIKISSPLVNIIMGKTYTLKAEKSFYSGDVNET